MWSEFLNTQRENRCGKEVGVGGKGGGDGRAISCGVKIKERRGAIKPRESKKKGRNIGISGVNLIRGNMGLSNRRDPSKEEGIEFYDEKGMGLRDCNYTG